MDIFNTIASGASAGSMVGGCIAVLTRQPKVMGAAVGGLVGAGCGLAVEVGKAVMKAPQRPALY